MELYDIRVGDKVRHYEYGELLVVNIDKLPAWVQLSNGKFVDAAFIESAARPVYLTPGDAAALRHCLRVAKADSIKNYGSISGWFDEMIERIPDNAALAEGKA